MAALFSHSARINFQQQKGKFMIAVYIYIYESKLKFCKKQAGQTDRQFNAMFKIHANNHIQVIQWKLYNKNTDF